MTVPSGATSSTDTAGRSVSPGWSETHRCDGTDRPGTRPGPAATLSWQTPQSRRSQGLSDCSRLHVLSVPSRPPGPRIRAAWHVTAGAGEPRRAARRRPVLDDGSFTSWGRAMGTTETPVIEVALTTRPDRNPTTGRTPAEVVEQGLACIDAGASIVHAHLPDLNLSAALSRPPGSTSSCSSRGSTATLTSCACPPTASATPWSASATSGRSTTSAPSASPSSTRAQPSSARPAPTARPSPTATSTRSTTTPWALPSTRAPPAAWACTSPASDRLAPQRPRLLAGRSPCVNVYFGGNHGVPPAAPASPSGSRPPLTGLAASRELVDLDGCGTCAWFSAVVGGDLLATPVACATVEQGGHLHVGLEDHMATATPPTWLWSTVVRVGRAPGGHPAQTIETLRLPREATRRSTPVTTRPEIRGSASACSTTR